MKIITLSNHSRAHLRALIAVVALSLSLLLGGQSLRAQEILPGFPALTLTYIDGQGPGQVSLRPQGADPATGGTIITVTLSQNGTAYTGEGFVRPLDARSFVIAFTVSDGAWGSYFLRGTLIREGNGWTGHGRYTVVGNPAVTDAWRMESAPAPRPTLSTSVRLEPVGDPRVRGTVLLVAVPEGATRYSAELAGLVPGATYTLRLHAGTIAQPSASFTVVATVTANGAGRAAASGLVRFRGTENIPLLDIADGNHVLTVVGFDQTVAAGTIPVLQPLG